MGIIHFAGLGKSPGAVTAGLSYLKNEVGDSTDYGRIVEGLVIFTSPEILDGKEKAYLSTDNEYMTRTVRKRWADRLENPFEIVKEFIYHEFEDIDFHVCEVDVNNFSECFEVIAKTLLKFHHPGEVGKHIWANLTGGTNVLNAALMQVAYFSGFIPILYYTFVANVKEDGGFLKPFSRDESEFDFRKIYVFKAIFDERYQYILEELESSRGKWLTSSDLLTRLKGKRPDLFEEMDLTSFRRDFLNTMLGVQRKGERAKGQEDLNSISKDGEGMLGIIRSPLFKALLRQTCYSLGEIEKLTEDLKINRIGSLGERKWKL
ncbi:MAG: hypothetical protein QHH17_04975 [Candidatus Bathyarchaeota archaeon]|jgi:hypothetical protein|nr:hypothetical protein [Candidatus Bathyarchaeota archaeon]